MKCVPGMKKQIKGINWSLKYTSHKVKSRMDTFFVIIRSIIVLTQFYKVIQKDVLNDRVYFNRTLLILDAMKKKKVYKLFKLIIKNLFVGIKRDKQNYIVNVMTGCLTVNPLKVIP